MRYLILLGLALSCCSVGCQSHNYTQQGAVVGGLTGGGVGAIVGELASDKPVVGAAVGSAIGALTGATVGSGLDEVDARNEARVQQAAFARSASGTTISELVAMSDAGLSDQIIVRHVRDHGFYQALDAADLIALRQQGVSDAVIAALQSASAPTPAAGVPSEVILESPAPVVIEEQLVPIGPRPWRSRHWRNCPPYARRPGVQWGISIGH